MKFLFAEARNLVFCFAFEHVMRATLARHGSDKPRVARINRWLEDPSIHHLNGFVTTRR